jgi:hypothetical protein
MDLIEMMNSFFFSFGFLLQRPERVKSVYEAENEKGKDTSKGEINM